MEPRCLELRGCFKKMKEQMLRRGGGGGEFWVLSLTLKSRESQNSSHTEMKDPNSPHDFIV